MRTLLGIVLLAIAAVAQAQSDVGLVNLVSGDVSFAPRSGQPGKVKAFMKVREGDRFVLSPGAELRIVYFDGARQESWKGPSSFRTASARSAALSGKPQVTQLPASVPGRMSRIPELMQNAKLGGVQVRGTRSSPSTPPEPLEEAKANYQTLRGEFPADDITPELYFFSALNDYQRYDDMVPVVNEMMRKQPENEDVKALAAWLIERRGAR